MAARHLKCGNGDIVGLRTCFASSISVSDTVAAFSGAQTAGQDHVAEALRMGELDVRARVGSEYAKLRDAIRCVWLKRFW